LLPACKSNASVQRARMLATERRPGRFVFKEAPSLNSVRQPPWKGCGFLQRFWIILAAGLLDGLLNQARGNGLQIFLAFTLQTEMRGERFPLPKRGWARRAAPRSVNFAEDTECSPVSLVRRPKPVCRYPSLLRPVFQASDGRYGRKPFGDRFLRTVLEKDAIP